MYVIEKHHGGGWPCAVGRWRALVWLPPLLMDAVVGVVAGRWCWPEAAGEKGFRQRRFSVHRQTAATGSANLL
jgi:hypothetical protein